MMNAKKVKFVLFLLFLFAQSASYGQNSLAEMSLADTSQTVRDFLLEELHSSVQDSKVSDGDHIRKKTTEMYETFIVKSAI